jgi:translin
MLNKKEFAKIRAELVKSEKARELLIQDSREIIRLSKLIIYALHRGDLKKAAVLVKKIKSKTKNLPSENYGTGVKNVALQEYTEAMALFSFVKTKKIPTRSELGVDTGNYLAGLCDLTGELVRMAVNRAIKKQYDDVFKIKNLVEAIYGEFLQLDLRGGELRKKSDQIKWNLQKLENTAYDIMKMKNKCTR